MMIKSSRNSMYKAIFLVFFISMLFAPMLVSASDDNITIDNLVDDPPSVWDIGHWFIETSGYFMHNISEKGADWFGIDPSIMIFFMLVLFLYVIRAKANGWVFWIFLLIILFFVASGPLNLGAYI